MSIYHPEPKKPLWEERLDSFFESAFMASAPDSIKVDYALLKHDLKTARRQVERMALCPDHRDKGTGTCIVCQAEKRTRIEENRLRRENP